MSVLKISLAVFFAVSSVLLFAPRSLDAQGLSAGTLVTFDQEIAIPGHVLPAGAYAFVETGASVVQVWNKDQSKLIATLITNAASQPEFEKRQEFEFESAGPSRPTELKAWFKDGKEDKDVSVIKLTPQTAYWACDANGSRCFTKWSEMMP